MGEIDSIQWKILNPLNPEQSPRDDRAELLAKLNAIDDETASQKNAAREKSRQESSAVSPASNVANTTNPSGNTAPNSQANSPAQSSTTSPAQPSKPTPKQEQRNFLEALHDADRSTQHLKPKRKAKPAPQRPSAPPKAQAKPTTQAASPYQQPTNTTAPQPPRASDYPIPSVIEQLTLYAKEKLEARAEQRRQEQARAALEAKVQAWLDDLDPLSDDGFWFEQFAENYSSRMEAAIAFLNPKTPKP